MHHSPWGTGPLALQSLQTMCVPFVRFRGREKLPVLLLQLYQ